MQNNQRDKKCFSVMYQPITSTWCLYFGHSQFKMGKMQIDYQKKTTLVEDMETLGFELQKDQSFSKCSQ